MADTRYFKFCGGYLSRKMGKNHRSECAADILLIDDSIANQWELLYEICRQVSPSQIVITTTGYSEHSDSFCSIPVTLLQQETLQFRFLR